jgi:NAD-dependent SIR2 family protein deacetylase
MLAIAPTDRIFVVTGAGMSAESGIPTLRGVNRLWRNDRISRRRFDGTNLYEPSASLCSTMIPSG